MCVRMDIICDICIPYRRKETLAVGNVGDWPWMHQIHPIQISPVKESLTWWDFNCAIIWDNYANVHFEVLQPCICNYHGTWPIICSMRFISFFITIVCGPQGFPTSYLQISFPLTGLVHKLLYSWYPHTIEFNEACTSTPSLLLSSQIDTQCKRFYRIYFPKYFHSGNGTNSPNFLLLMCLCCKFAEFSHCQSFPLYVFCYLLYFA